MTMILPLVALVAQVDVDTDGLSEAIDSDGITGGDWLVAAGVLAGAILLAYLAGKALARALEGSRAMPLIRRLTRYAIVTLGLIYALNAVGVRVGPLLGALGILGIAMAFALQDAISNFVAGLLIQVRRPFVLGDQIATLDHEGTVVDVNARTVVLDTPDGVRVFLPAGQVIQGPVENYTDHGRRRTTLQIGVEYRTDLEEARRVLRDAAASCDEVLAEPAPEALVTEFADSSIVIALRFWHQPSIAEFWAARDAVAVAAKAQLDDAGIGIPFPQSVVTFAAGTTSEDEGRP